MGGSSESNQQANTTQETTTQSTSGLNTGEVLQANGPITVNQDFSKEVQGTISEILGTLNKTIDTAAQAGGQALTAIQERYTAQENPSLVTTQKQQNLYMILGAAILVAMVYKK